MPWSQTLLVLLLSSSLGVAGDWPQWLGPHRDGSSPEKVEPWQKPPRILWRQPVGEGNSSPVVAGGRVFVHSKPPDTRAAAKNREDVLAFDAATGKPLWRSSYARAPFQSLYGNGPRATPAVAGGKLYTFGVTGILTCFDVATGKQLWQVDTLQKFQARNLFFGMSCSPLVENSEVMVNVGANQASIVAFDKDSGKVVWKSLSDHASYSSPIIFGPGENRQVVFLTQQAVVALNPRTGALFWRFPLVDQLLESSSTPARTGDILLASSITYGSVGLHLLSSNGHPQPAKAWKNDRLTCYFSTPIGLEGRYFYLVTGTKPPALFPEATLHCIEAQTGKELWNRQKVGKYHASLLRTGNNRILLLEEDGNLVLLRPNPSRYEELARAKVSGETWAHPALAHGRLYVRDNKELLCLELP